MPSTKPTKPENVMGFCFQALHLKWKENSDLNAGRQISLSCHKWVIKLIHLHVEWSEANLVCKTSGCTLYVTTTIYGCWRGLIDGSYQLTCIYGYRQDPFSVDRLGRLLDTLLLFIYMWVVEELKTPHKAYWETLVGEEVPLPSKVLWAHGICCIYSAASQ